MRGKKIIKKKIFSDKDGGSLLEIIVATAIFSLIGAAMISMAVGGFVSLDRGGEQTEAAALAEEGLEAVRSIRDGAWNEIIYSESGVAAGSGQWVFKGEGTSDTIGQYARNIFIEDVCRDVADNITACPGSYTDLHSKKITVAVSWNVPTGGSNSVQGASYLTNWDSIVWQEDVVVDFNDGTLNGTATTTTEGDLDGAIILQVQ